MPTKNESPIKRVHEYLTLFIALAATITIVTTYASGKASSEELQALSQKHDEDIATLKKDMNQLKVEEYTDQIHILESQPELSPHDEATVKYLKNRKADLMLKMQGEL